MHTYFYRRIIYTFICEWNAMSYTKQENYGVIVLISPVSESWTTLVSWCVVVLHIRHWQILSVSWNYQNCLTLFWFGSETKHENSAWNRNNYKNDYWRKVKFEIWKCSLNESCPDLCNEHYSCNIQNSLRSLKLWEFFHLCH